MNPPEGTTTVCGDELGPVTPRTFPPPAGWSPDGHRITYHLDYQRGPDKVWIYGALRVVDGQELTLSRPARNTAGFLQLLEAVDAANPQGELQLIVDNLSSHNSAPIRAWLLAHPRIHLVFLPVGAGWLNLQEPWWRLFRHEGLAGQSFANAEEIDQARQVATDQLNRRAQPWVWGRPPPTPRLFRQRLVYSI